MTGVGSDADVLKNLVERVRRGDAEAEAEVVRQFSQRIYIMSFVRTRDREAARDLVQEILMAVIAALRKGQLQDPEKLPAFVHGTARNLINNQLREAGQRPPLDPLPEDLPRASMIAELEQAERVAIVRQALRELGAEDRRILWMTMVEGRKPSDIASLLGLSAEVVRTRKLRAARRVAEVVQKRLSRSQLNLPHT